MAQLVRPPTPAVVVRPPFGKDWLYVVMLAVVAPYFMPVEGDNPLLRDYAVGIRLGESGWHPNPRPAHMRRWVFLRRESKVWNPDVGEVPRDLCHLNVGRSLPAENCDRGLEAAGQRWPAGYENPPPPGVIRKNSTPGRPMFTVSFGW